MIPPVVRFRFWAKVADAGADDCWLWTGAKNSAGYGNFWAEERFVNAHVVAYRLSVGEIPAGMYVCHRCDTPSCVRPDHLWLGTARDNAMDKVKKGRWRGGGHWSFAHATCWRGHPWTEENTYWYRGHRACRECIRLRGRANYRRYKEESRG